MPPSNVPPPDPAALVASLAARPGDELARERVARALLDMQALPELREALTGLAHFDAHDEGGLPCLCKRCWEMAPPLCQHGGVPFTRDLVVKSARVLMYWAPVELTELARHRVALQISVRASLARRLAVLAKSRKKQPRPEF